MGELYKGVTRDLNASHAERLASVAVFIHDCHTSLRLYFFCLGRWRIIQQGFISCKSERLPLDGFPINPVRLGPGIIFCDVARIYDFILYVREVIVRRYHCILPGQVPFRYLRVMIPVSLLLDGIVHRVIEDIEPLAFQVFILLLRLWQETDIQVGRFHLNPVRLGRIKRLQRLGNISGGVRIFQTVTKYNLVMRDIPTVIIIDSIVKRHPPFAARHCCECD